MRRTNSERNYKTYIEEWTENWPIILRRPRVAATPLATINADKYMPTMSPLRKTTISFMVRDIFLRFANICKKRQIKTDARRKRSSEEKLTKTKKLRVKSYVTGNGCQQRPHHRNVSPRSDQRRMDGHPLFSVNIGQCLTYHDSVYSCLVHPDCTCNRLSTPHTVRY